MHTLLEYIKKDRLADALVEKLCLRFDAGDNGGDRSQSRNLAFCLAQVCCMNPAAGDLRTRRFLPLSLLPQGFRSVACSLCAAHMQMRHSGFVLRRLYACERGQARRKVERCIPPPLQLSISEKGFKKMVELHKHYKEQLLDPDVLASFQVCCGGKSIGALPCFVLTQRVTGKSLLKLGLDDVCGPLTGVNITSA